MSKTTVEYILVENLGENGGRVAFRSVEDAELWVQKETEFWQWLKSCPAEARPLQHTINQINQHLNTLQGAVNAWKVHPSDMPTQTQQVNVITQVLSQYRSGALLHSTSSAAMAVDTLRKDLGEYEAIVGLAIETKAKSIPVTDPKALHGAVMWTLIREGINKSSVTVAKRSFSTLLTKIGERNDSDEQHGHQIRQNLDTLLENCQASHKRLWNDSDRAIGKASRQFEIDRKSQAAQLATFQDVYKKAISLQAPVQYWKKKRDWHRVGAVVTVLVIIGYVYFVNIQFFKLPESVLDITFWKEASLAMFGLAAVAITIVWSIARALYRMFLSQLHLGNDASERVTMVETYLALASEGHNKDEHLKSLFNRLFAPAADGIVKDDLGAIGIVDGVQRVLSKH